MVSRCQLPTKFLEPVYRSQGRQILGEPSPTHSLITHIALPHTHLKTPKMLKSQSQLTLEEFLALPDNDVAYELIDGQAVPKMSPKFFHSTVQKALLLLLDQWSEGRGRVEPEWSVILKRQGKDWVPTPDLLYISYEEM